ncbi:MAG TPA: HAMP domain-containing protein, partial [Ensifer sp.]|nr:HAMP domain-containing protein [Ensifer sp.]
MRFTIKAKLAAAFGLLIILAAGMSSLAIFKLSSLNEAINTIIEGPTADLKASSELVNLVGLAVRGEKNAILSSDAQQIQGYVQKVRNYKTNANEIAAKLERSRDKTVVEKMAEFKQAFGQWNTIDEQVLTLALENSEASNKRGADLTMNEGSKNANAMTEALAGVSKAVLASLNTTNEETDQEYAMSRNLLIGGLAGMLVLSVGIALWIALGINSGLKKIRAVAEGVATGDLNQNVEIKTNDEIRDLVDTINTMTQNLRATAASADRIAAGDLSVDIKLLSEKDTLGISMQGMVSNLRVAANAANAISIGDLSTDVVPASDRDVLGVAMRGMVTNLRETARVADQIANGDLTVNVKPMSEKDTLGLSLQSMVERLRGVVSDALSAADNVSSGSQQLSSGSEQLSQGATEQASSAEEASASMEEMAANIKQNADNAAQTEKIARQSSKDAEASGEAVNRAVNAMRTIAEKISIVQEIARQ